ncbi:hypothetical protein [Nonomuraea sp. 10N515B]
MARRNTAVGSAHMTRSRTQAVGALRVLSIRPARAEARTRSWVRRRRARS